MCEWNLKLYTFLRLENNLLLQSDENDNLEFEDEEKEGEDRKLSFADERKVMYVGKPEEIRTGLLKC